MAKKRRASAAARKGWATRRAKERARSKAARKGWSTRRRHAKAKPKRRRVREYYEIEIAIDYVPDTRRR